MALTLEDLRASKSAAISVREASEVLGLDPRTVTDEIRKGGIPSIRVGRRILVPRDRFLALFAVEEQR